MSAKEKKHYLNATLWLNLFIGIYNIYIFIQLNSIFHLVLGSINIGVWVFNRDRLIPIIRNSRILSTKKK